MHSALHSGLLITGVEGRQWPTNCTLTGIRLHKK